MRYLVAVDGFEQSRRALALARDQVAGTDATLDVVHVVAEGAGDQDVKDQIRETVEEVMAGSDVSYELHFPEADKNTQPAKKVGQRLLSFASEHDHDVIYVGSKETGTAERMIIGSVTSTLVEDRSVPVVLVP
jgi:nucleotide-binding universal stress UspA family protein